MTKQEKLKEELMVVSAIITSFRLIRFTVFAVGYGWICWLIIMSSGPILTPLNLILFIAFILAMRFIFKILYFVRKDQVRIATELSKI